MSVNAVLENIYSEDILNDEKISALKSLVKSQKINHITKYNLLAAIDWLLDYKLGWTPFSESQPAVEEPVLVTDGRFTWIDELVGDDSDEVWWDASNDDPYETAWMYLPEGWNK